VDGVRIDHTGWFCDEYGTKIRGIVVALPHGRFLAGWSMGEGMASTVDADLYDTAEDAAYAADSMAESAADSMAESAAEANGGAE
jgi:predicted GNAT superfamily acetyltransferase